MRQAVFLPVTNLPKTIKETLMKRGRRNTQTKKGTPFGIPLNWLAEAQRFELWNPFGSPVFKTGAFNRSATLPQ